MKKTVAKIITAAIFVAAGLFFKLALVGYSFLAYCLFAAAACIAYFLAADALKNRHEKLSKLMRSIAVYGLLLFAITFVTTEVIIINEARREPENGAEYAIVMGAGINGTSPSPSLRARLNAALSYAEDNPDTVFILSGSQGPDEQISEAQCMYDWLRERGIDESHLIIEDCGGDTFGNVKYSKDIIFGRDPDFSGSICIVTESYHIMRSKTTAERAGFENVTAISGYSGYPVLTVNYFIRESFAMWYYLLMSA